ncbi:MAG: hypothetical protein IJF64_00600 [Clostridia bacterium]|nr:hypothetical protein [Clostridia bacterium]
MSFGKVFILGDSYSTFKGYIPEDHAPWYWEGGHDATDVEKVEQTWWKQLIDETGSELLLNCSWSGTTVGNTGYNGEDYTEISFIGRLKKLIQKGYFKENKPDTLLLFGGTNDSWSGAPVGELQYGDWTKEDLFKVLPAFCYLVDLIKKELPDTKLVVIVNTELSEPITKGFQEGSKAYGATCVMLEKIDKIAGHPSIAGMRKICDQIIKGV